MKLPRSIFVLAACLLISNYAAKASGTPRPVNPNVSPEAKSLLDFLYSISGKYTLTGQHNYPNSKSRNSEFAARYIGKTPVIFSSDFGFAKDGDKDSYLARKDIVIEAIKEYKAGSIITLMWHAVPPTANEPVTFQPEPGKKVSPDSLASVQGQLTDQQFKDLLTPGTEIYNHWCTQVDSVAYYLKQLQDAHVPVLWRPYHEMNGDWFWWGGRRGQYGTAALYRQLFDRLVNFHKLNNLIWVWSVDRPSTPERQFVDYYPGNNYLDILSLDVYGNDFNQAYYDSLLSLSKGKPIALAEVGNPPAPEILAVQPDWLYYVTWAGMVRNTLKKQYDNLMSDNRVLNRDDSIFVNLTKPYRETCGLPPVTIPAKPKMDFSGNWALNEDKSVFDNMGISFFPDRMKIYQYDNDFIVQKSFVQEYTDDQVTTDTLTLDGKESKSELYNSPMVTTAFWSQDGDSLKIISKLTFNRGGRTMEMVTEQSWTLLNSGNSLAIQQVSNSFLGKRKATLYYDKK